MHSTKKALWYGKIFMSKAGKKFFYVEIFNFFLLILLRTLCGGEGMLSHIFFISSVKLYILLIIVGFLSNFSKLYIMLLLITGPAGRNPAKLNISTTPGSTKGLKMQNRRILVSDALIERGCIPDSYIR